MLWQAGDSVLSLAGFLDSSQLIKSHQYLVTAAGTMNQYAAIEALTGIGKDDAITVVQGIHRRQLYHQEMSAIRPDIVNPLGWGLLYLLRSTRISSKFLRFWSSSPEKGCCLYPRTGFWPIWRRLCALVLCSKYGNRSRSDESVEGVYEERRKEEHAGALKVVASSLYHRDYREDDKLVKIFRASWQAHVFVKHANRSRLNSMIQPLNLADMYLYLKIMTERIVSRYSWGSKFQGLIKIFFVFLRSLYTMPALDHCAGSIVFQSVITAWLQSRCWWIGLSWNLDQYFEMQILSRFGVCLKRPWECASVIEVGLPFDFCSFRLGGVLAQIIMIVTKDRPTGIPNTLCLLDRFQAVKFSELPRDDFHPWCDEEKELRKCPEPTHMMNM